MRTNVIGKLITLVLLAAVTQSGYAASRGGGGFHSVSATRPGFNRGNTGTRFAFGARPSYGRPVYVRPPTSAARTSAYSSRNSALGNRTASTPRVASVNGSVAQAGTHVISGRAQPGAVIGIVAAVQKDLTRLGYYRSPIDGLYGRATRDAVAHYQGAKTPRDYWHADATDAAIAWRASELGLGGRERRLSDRAWPADSLYQPVRKRLRYRRQQAACAPSKGYKYQVCRKRDPKGLRLVG